MSAQNSAFSWQEDKLVLQIFLQPSTSQNEWYGRHDGQKRIRVTAPPFGNQANVECVKFLAKSLNTAKTNVSVIREQTSRANIVEVLKPDRTCWKKF